MNIDILSEFPPLPELAAAHGTEEIFEWIALLESVAAAKTSSPWSSLAGRRGIWFSWERDLLPRVHILHSHNIILAQITPDLHLDQFQCNLPGLASRCMLPIGT
jgi:hypothetical protein